MLVSTLVPAAGNEEGVREQCARIVGWAQGKLDDPASGLKEFHAHADELDSNVVHIWQRFASADAMGRLHNTVEYATFHRDVAELLVEPMAMGMYRSTHDGKISCLMYPFGPKGEGGVDDATGQGGMAGGVGYKQHVKVDLTGDVSREEESGGRIWNGVMGKMKSMLDKVATES